MKSLALKISMAVLSMIPLVAKAELIVLASPQSNDAYYVKMINVKIREIITPYDGSEIYDEKFGSACGLYTNMLVTPERIYFPQFGIKEDAVALQQIRSITKRTVVPVQSSNVCHMGGGVRCMSWQVRGKNAELFLNYLNKISK